MSATGKVLQVTYDVVTDKNTFPSERTALTGTISQLITETRVVGVGTLFTSELKAGDWIYVGVTNEVRQVESIIDDLTLILRNAFSVAVVAQVGEVFDDVPYLRELTILNIGTVNGLLQGNALPPNYAIVIHVDENRPIQPITYDASGVNVTFSILATW